MRVALPASLSAQSFPFTKSLETLVENNTPNTNNTHLQRKSDHTANPYNDTVQCTKIQFTATVPSTYLQLLNHSHSQHKHKQRFKLELPFHQHLDSLEQNKVSSFFLLTTEREATTTYDRKERYDPVRKESR